MPLSAGTGKTIGLLVPLPRQEHDLGDESARDEALRQSPGRPVVLLRPVPVMVRAMPGCALAYTVTHVLVECLCDGCYRLRWEASWLVRKASRVPVPTARG